MTDFCQSILDAMDDSVAIIDSRAEIVAVNKAWLSCAESGGVPELSAGVGDNFLNVLYQQEDSVPQVEHGLRNVMNGSRSEFSGFSCFGHNGNHQRRAISAQFLGNHTLIKLRKLTQLIDSANAPIFGIDIDGRVNEWNRKAAEITGFERDEVIGLDLVEDFITEEYKTPVREVLANALVGEETSNYELPLYTQDGQRVQVLLNATTRRDSNDQVVGVLGVGQDITERVRAEQEVQALNADLETRVSIRTAQLATANKELEAFSYSVSHDLRSPLRTINGFSQLLLDEYKDLLDDEGADYLQRIRRATQKMGDLIDDLLQLSRLIRGDLNREDVNISEVVRSVLKTLEDDSSNRQVELFIEPGIKVNCDPSLLRAALGNLFENAWKFTAHKPEARIEFGVVKNGNETVYFVKDNGAGFDMRYVDKLFGAFQRLHPPGEFEGTGIGLATVQRIIHRHGGRIWAEGKKEEGATFYFTIGDPEVKA